MPICLGNTAFKQVKEELMIVADPFEQDSSNMYICTIIGKTSAPPKTAKETITIFRNRHQPVASIVVQEMVKPA